MAKRETMTRAKKIAAATKAAGESKKTPRRQGVAKTDTPAEQPTNQVTSMVLRAGKPKLAASYAQLVAHRKPVVDAVKATLTIIAKSYDESDSDDRDERHKRYELANKALDFLTGLFDNNGFSNNGDRLVFAWLMLDLLRPAGHRTEEVLDLIEEVFEEHHQVLTEHGLGLEIKRRRERQKQYQEDKKKAA